MSADADNGGEFDVIKRLFAPLSAAEPGAFNLTDDAAVLTVDAGCDMVLTKDAMVGGVHFLENDNPQNIARKLLRTNLSDIAAMGAKPVAYLLATAWPDSCNEAWIKVFVQGLAADQMQYGVTLIGGDTVRTSGPLTLSLTLIGKLPKGQALRRCGAQADDLLCVSGTIGDAALGLKVTSGLLDAGAGGGNSFLEKRYFLPQPRVSLGPALLGVATSCIDISDGLLADIAHIATQSGVGMEIRQDQIPLSNAARALIEQKPDLWASIFSGGDDYELAFTVAPENLSEIVKKADALAETVSIIGKVTSAGAVVVTGNNGQVVPFEQTGWTHF